MPLFEADPHAGRRNAPSCEGEAPLWGGTNPYVRRVCDRNEPDPEKWLPGDPFGHASDRDL